MFVPAPDRAITAHRERGDTLHAYISLTKPLDWFDQIDFTDPAAAATRVAAEFDGWAPEITALITGSDTPPVLRPHFALPDGHRWQRTPGVTLIGDAAHLQAPQRRGSQLGHVRRRRTRRRPRRSPRRLRSRPRSLRTGPVRPHEPGRRRDEPAPRGDLRR
ncbi:hypothetical protein [Nonomuraea salmonea]|uniref:hypothetical protein n=1 Tax=Nonomuraea salmonea TaxID=46181 RepID=UPI0031E9B6C4